jgi:hypothetical protein
MELHSDMTGDGNALARVRGILGMVGDRPSLPA